MRTSNRSPFKMQKKSRKREATGWREVSQHGRRSRNNGRNLTTRGKKHTKRGRIHTKKSKYCISALTPKHLRLQISVCEGKQLYGVLPYGVTVI